MINTLWSYTSKINHRPKGKQEQMKKQVREHTIFKNMKQTLEADTTCRKDKPKECKFPDDHIIVYM